jgi:hypothetical protein
MLCTMVYFPLLFPTHRDRKLKALLAATVSSDVLPLLFSMGFDVLDTRSKRGFPSRYARQREGNVDVIHFHWMRFGQPAFIIDFDTYDGTDLSDERVRENYLYALRYRARSNTGLIERWFHIGFIPRLISASRAAQKEANKAKARVVDIDDFVRGGPMSPFLEDIEASIQRRAD